jgi:hypothetical protein
LTTIRLLSSLTILLFTTTLAAQVMEEAVPLQAVPREAGTVPETVADTIGLPIVDDFSYKSTKPNPAIWSDDYVLISSTLSVGEKSIGTAVFDGTDELGLPYNINNNSSDSIADYLTSHYIRFASPPSNLVLTFLYQRGGNGETPEVDDSLVVELWSPIDSGWTQVWGAKGTGSATPFQAAAIPIDSSKYLADGFRFRMGAYGARNGVFDIWNIDYVELDVNRNVGDTIVNEPAFVRQHPYVTGTFTHLPWFHYSDNRILNDITFTYRRNGPIPSGGWSLNLGKYIIEKDGNPVKDRLTVPVITILDHDVDLDFSAPVQPINTGAITGEFDLFMRTWFDGTAEGLRSNDTVERTIPFKNYYGFDDGTAERAYGILNQANAHFAIEFEPLQPDTLKGLYISFAHAGVDATEEKFRIAVWRYNSNGRPGLPLFVSDSLYEPQYPYAQNGFIPFDLDTSIFIPGRVFIGIIQPSTTPLHMGLDVNTPNATPKFYGDGLTWFQSLVAGTVMLRPYFQYTPFDFGVDEPPILNSQVYPNPTTDKLIIDVAEPDATWQLINTMGQVVSAGSERELVVNHLPRGLYILQISSKLKRATHRVILQ